jgi:hypothetical protein
MVNVFQTLQYVVTLIHKNFALGTASQPVVLSQNIVVHMQMNQVIPYLKDGLNGVLLNTLLTPHQQ